MSSEPASEPEPEPELRTNSRTMNCTGQSEATFMIGKKVECCEIDLWHTLESPDGGALYCGRADWSLEMVEELAIATGMAGGRIIASGEEPDPEPVWKHGPCDSTEFINDPEIETALDLWRDQDNMDDISEPSYFTQWDQSLNGTTWVTDGNPQNLDPVLLTPERLQQTDKLNILWDEEDPYQVIADQLVTLEVLAIGDKHGVAKSPYGGVFVTKGTLTFLQRMFNVGNVGDKFMCWITFDGTKKYPWRTVVNGVVARDSEGFLPNW